MEIKDKYNFKVYLGDLYYYMLMNSKFKKAFLILYDILPSKKITKKIINDKYVEKRKEEMKNEIKEKKDLEEIEDMKPAQFKDFEIPIKVKDNEDLREDFEKIKEWEKTLS